MILNFNKRYFFSSIFLIACMSFFSSSFHKPRSRLAGQTFIITQILIYQLPITQTQEWNALRRLVNSDARPVDSTLCYVHLTGAGHLTERHKIQRWNFSCPSIYPPLSISISISISPPLSPGGGCRDLDCVRPVNPTVSRSAPVPLPLTSHGPVRGWFLFWRLW